MAEKLNGIQIMTDIFSKLHPLVQAVMIISIAAYGIVALIVGDVNVALIIAISFAPAPALSAVITILQLRSYLNGKMVNFQLFDSTKDLKSD
jgi:hypothetical protein